MSDNRASWLSIATALFFSWSFLTLCVRIWVRMGRKQKWGIDDSTISAAFAIALFHVATTFWAISHGYGLPFASIPESNRGQVEKALYGSQLFYIISSGLTKVSTALFIGRLTHCTPKFRTSYYLAAAAAVWTSVSTLVISLRGNLSQPWATLDGSEALYIRWIVIEAVGLAIEVALWVLQVVIVWVLQMTVSQRILILSAFGCRLLLIPIITARLFYLAPSENPDPTFTSILANIFTEASLEFCLISASTTCLKPLLRPFHTITTAGTPVNGNRNLESGIHTKTSDAYILSPLSTLDQDSPERMKAKRSREPTFQSKYSKEPTSFRTTPPSNQLEAHTVNSAWRDRHREDLESIESMGSDRMIIRTTKNWSIWYEER